METVLRVILIDDSAVDAELVFYEISKHYIAEHVLVDNAHDLRRVLNEKLWDLVLCDYSMPDFNPYKAVDILREYDMDIPLIVISGTIGEEKAIKLLKAGCSDCIMKSNLTRLPGIIDRELKETGTRKENKELYRKLKKYQILADEASDIMLFIDLKGEILDANLSAIKKYGYSYEELITLNISDLRRENDKRYIESQMKTAEGKGILFEDVHYRKDGSAFNVEVSSQGGLLDDKKMLLCVIRDITERKKIEGQREQSLKDLLESQRIAHIGTWSLNLATNQVVWSDELYKMYGFDPTIPPPPYTEHMNLFTPESWDKLSAALESARTSGIPYELELKTIKADGSNGWIWVRGQANKDTGGSIISLWGAAQDITEQKKNQEKLIYMIYHDHLTGLYNRRFFEEELNRLDTKKNLPLTIIMGDINGLKIINDSFGHAVGDNYLKKISEIIRKACRADDIIARLGGDEFVVILPNADTSEAIKIIEHIKDIISETNVGAIELSVSFGFAAKESEKQSVLETVVNAENHMYTHKIYERASMRSKTIDIIMNTLFEKSNRESQHSNRVSALCEAIASNMDFDKDDVNQIRIAGLVHDIGKIGIKENILNKAGRLDNDEWEEMKKHPEAGWRILITTIEFSEISKFVLRHHERWNGSGYPNGLKGEEIPIEARIIAVADAYDAMTSERTYKNAYSKDEAINELTRCSGTHFDPKIVDVFVNQVLPYNSNFEGV